MKFDAIRFCVGPWNGKYSSVWRVWSNPKSDDIYLAVRSLAQYMKISLHKTGKYRVAFTERYNQKLIEQGKDEVVDRSFLKWTKKSVGPNEIMQAIDIHFPLNALSLKTQPEGSKGKQLIVFQPHEKSIGDNDTITAKILFHRLDPNGAVFHGAAKKRGVIPIFYFSLSNGEFASLAFQYTKQLPINISKKEISGYAAMFHNYFNKSGKKVGDTIESLTLQLFQMGYPPSVNNIGGLSILWESEKHFSVSK